MPDSRTKKLLKNKIRAEIFKELLTEKILKGSTSDPLCLNSLTKFDKKEIKIRTKQKIQRRNHTTGRNISTKSKLEESWNKVQEIETRRKKLIKDHFKHTGEPREEEGFLQIHLSKEEEESINNCESL